MNIFELIFTLVTKFERNISIIILYQKRQKRNALQESVYLNKEARYAAGLQFDILEREKFFVAIK